VSTFFFETITAGQALAFNGQTDTLLFSNPATTGASLRVTYNPATATSQTSLTMMDVTGHLVVFGVGLENPTFTVNGTALGVSIPGGEEIIASPRDDGIFGLGGADTLHGLGGDDVLQGGGGVDVLEGGAGADLFLIAPGDSPAATGQLDTVIDWSSADRLSFPFQNGQILTPAGNASNYVETAAGSFSAALTAANAQIAGGVVEYVAVQVGSDVIVFADDQGDHGAADDAVTLRGRTLADIGASNITFETIAPHAIVSLPSSPPPPISPPPTSPPPISPPPPPVSPPPPGAGVTATISGSIDAVHLQDILGVDIVSTSPSLLVLQGGGVSLTLRGFGFTFDADEQLTGGTVTSIDFGDPIGPGSTIITHGHIDGLSMPVATLVQYAFFNDNLGAFSTIFAGNDVINGSFGTDLIRGFGGADTIQSSDFGQDRLFGGDGDDRLVGSALGFNYLDGGRGVDTLVAGGNVAGTFIEFGANESPAAAAAGGHLEKLDHVLNWTTDDFVIFTGGAVATPSTYKEITTASFDQAASVAQTNLAQGVEYTVAQVGGDLVVFDLKLADAVVLSGRTLADISQADVGGNPALAQPDPALSPPPPPPPPAPPPAFGTAADETFTVILNNAEVHAGAGNDTITEAVLGSNLQDYLRGDEGDDSISGGSGFDDSNGNMGNDTIHGNAGDDWSVGGKDGDLLFGDDGSDIVWGNLGADTCDGGAGADQCRGGQGDDSVSGGAGDDFVSGDRGNDTITGGAGADLFHGSQDAGIDRVLDFHLSEGDRVMLDPGTTFTVSQSGADTVIDMGAGNQMILVGVSMSSLSASSIFLG
jgi:Ca2+-binding RTX toxin-like protein